MRSWSSPARRRLAATLLAAAIATSVSACGGSSSSGGGGAATTASPPVATSSDAAPTSTGATTRSATTATRTSSASAGGSASSSSGLKVFASAGCSSCHTLAAAHASGDVGPNLDDLKPSAALVETQVTNGGAAMPSFAGRLSKAQIAAVAKFVASAAR